MELPIQDLLTNGEGEISLDGIKKLDESFGQRLVAVRKKVERKMYTGIARIPMKNYYPKAKETVSIVTDENGMLLLYPIK